MRSVLTVSAQHSLSFLPLVSPSDNFVAISISVINTVLEHLCSSCKYSAMATDAMAIGNWPICLPGQAVAGVLHNGPFLWVFV